MSGKELARLLETQSRVEVALTAILQPIRDLVKMSLGQAGWQLGENGNIFREVTAATSADLPPLVPGMRRVLLSTGMDGVTVRDEQTPYNFGRNS